jgi:hypothetical protein
MFIMRAVSFLSICACAAAAALTGCSSQLGVAPSGGVGAPTSPAMSPADFAKTGITPKDYPLIRFGRGGADAMPRHTAYAGLKDLYVTDVSYPGTRVVVYANKGYGEVTTIGNGVGDPFGDTLDSKGNFYVANAISGSDAVNVSEYVPGGSSPSTTYDAGMKDAINVATDRHGNVYEADYQGAFVNEYAQGKNVVKNTCSPGGGVEAIAVDKSGNVFVAYNSGSGKLVEYKGGLKGCNGTPLAPTFRFVGGMVIDSHGTLIVCDQENSVVDLIPSPYSSITGTLGTGFGTPFHVALNKANSRVFVTDVLNYDVQILKYPSGQSVTTLGSGEGLQNPFGVVDGPNAVY